MFEGLTFGVGEGSLRRLGMWRHLRNPRRPSWGEPYVEQVARMLTAAARARDAARGAGDGGGEAVCVSHQLPIWAVRLSVEGKPLWHDPRRRQCSLASLTSLTYDEDDRIVSLTYAEPARDLLPASPKRRLQAGA